MFELKNITKTFGGEVALKNVSLSISGGMNYIIGASGSGKTTLLRILSSMDRQYEGEAFYCGRNLKELSDQARSQFYATELGFIAQGFHLIDELTVRENILVPTYLSRNDSEKRLSMLLKKLGIEKLADQKVRTLSGGQKQRVAIARELMKDPQVLIADEPTAALDAKTAHEIGALLTSIAKERTVIVVTHDISLIQGKCSVFELDKGVLIRSDKGDSTTKAHSRSTENLRLTMRSALRMAGVTGKRQMGKLLSIVLAMAIAASCLAVNFSGMLNGSSSEAFQELLEKQGNSVLNLLLVPSFTSGGEVGKENPGVPQGVEQDISGLLEEYQNDDRIEAIIMDAPMEDMVVTVDGKDFIIEESGQSPNFNQIIAGRIADNSKNEIVLPKILVKKMGYTNEEILGKELSFVGSVYNWDSGKPVAMPISFTAKVSGIADTSYGIEFDGKVEQFEHEDSLFPSLAIMKDIYAQAEKENPSFSFTIRADSPEHFLELYDELMAKGIVPLGQAELIRDIMGLKGTALVQTGLSSALIVILSVLAALSVCLVCGFMRRKEYAVYRLCGYTKNSIVLLTLVEYTGMFLLTGLFSMIVALLLSVPLWLGCALSFGVSAFCFAETCLISTSVNPLTALKTGGRG